MAMYKAHWVPPATAVKGPGGALDTAKLRSSRGKFSLEPMSVEVSSSVIAGTSVSASAPASSTNGDGSPAPPPLTTPSSDTSSVVVVTQEVLKEHRPDLPLDKIVEYDTFLAQVGEGTVNDYFRKNSPPCEINIVRTRQGEIRRVGNDKSRTLRFKTKRPGLCTNCKRLYPDFSGAVWRHSDHVCHQQLVHIAAAAEGGYKARKKPRVTKTNGGSNADIVTTTMVSAGNMSVRGFPSPVPAIVTTSRPEHAQISTSAVATNANTDSETPPCKPDLALEQAALEALVAASDMARKAM